MKSKSFNDQQTISVNMYQNSPLPQFTPLRASNITRDYSNEQKIRRVSPAPQERFSHFSGNYLYPMSSFPSNQYQIPIRTVDQSISSLDNKKSIQDILAKIQRLELRSEKMEKIEIRMDKLENNFTKYQLKIENIENKKDQLPQGNQNRMNVQNCSQKSQDQLKQKIKNLITRQQLQRQLIGLDSAFKTLVRQMKSTSNLEMRQIHTKDKKAITEMVASQIAQKIQTFKSSFISELTNRIQQSVQTHFRNSSSNKSILGLERQKFLQTAIPLKLSQQLRFTSNGVQKTLAVSELSYFIDTQGYILDSNLVYLLDKNNMKIKLNESHLDVLRKEGLLNHSKQIYKLGVKDPPSISFNEK